MAIETLENRMKKRTVKHGNKRSAGNGWIVFILVVITGLAGALELSGAEFGVRFGTQRLDSGSQAFRPKVGLFYAFPLNSGGKFHVQIEAYYSSFRFEYAGTSSEGSSQSNKQTRYYDNLHYIEIPLLLKYRLPMMGDLQPVVLVGGYAAFRLSEREPQYDYLDANPDFWSEYSNPIVRDYASIESGLVVGIGVEHVGSKTRLSFDLRFNIGLTDMAKVTSYSEIVNEIGTVVAGDYQQRNRSLAFMVGISF